MSIATYADLKTAIANWIEDSSLTSRIPEFIALAQAKMYRGMMGAAGVWTVPPLRIRNMVTTADITVTSGSGSLPAGWIEFVRLWINDSGQPDLKYLPPQTFYDEAIAHDTSGTITHYTLEGSTIRTAPAASATLKSVHFAAFTALSGDSDTDWVLTNAPHVYLHGAVAEAWGYRLDGEKEAAHTARFADAIRGLNAQYRAAQTGGSQLLMRTRASA